MQQNDYYISKKSELLKNFNEFAKRTKVFLTAEYGEEFSIEVMDEMVKDYENIIPEIPYIGGEDNPMTQNLLSSINYLMVYEVLKRKDKSLEEIGNICYEMENEYLKTHKEEIFPITHPDVRDLLKFLAEQSGAYSEDFVYEIVEGEGFDVGLDFTECAISKFFNKKNADEFLPYLCAMDIPMSEYGNLGLHRTKTLADGFEHCDFRYKACRNTSVASDVIKR